VLDELADGATDVRFELAWVKPTIPDRLFAPLTRGWLRRGNDKAMARLGERLAT
jgi:hypothetical protein